MALRGISWWNLHGTRRRVLVLPVRCRVRDSVIPELLHGSVLRESLLS